MKQRIEHENKYTVTSLPNKDYWDRYVLVYQFILEINNNESKQLKIVFNFSTYKVNAILIKKQIISNNESNKQATYLNIKDINYDDLIGKQFVLKIRHIREPLFLL